MGVEQALGHIPALRRYARLLTGDAARADDLVQETMLKAWAARDRFQPGTSMRAWTFVILRNAYLTDMRRNRFRGEYDEGVAERILTAPAGQEEPIHLSDLHRALLIGSDWQKADYYFVLYELMNYCERRMDVNCEYRDRIAFGRKCLINIASSGKFSSDRTIREYAEEIWGLQVER